MRLLIIGSLGGEIGAASKIAMDRGAKVAHAGGVEAALEALRSGQGADLAMIDVRLDVRELITRLAAERISLPVVACGIEADSEAAVRAIRAGAREFIPLPPEPDLIAAVLEAVAEESDTIVHRDPTVTKLLALADQVANSEASILITGETGTGKELLARYVHRKSNRAQRPFVSVNCAAIPENLLESELFGHEKGAFTGAVKQTQGKIELADGGTLFLDEIGDLPLSLQVKLLRFLQERVIERIGGRKAIAVDVRVISATHQDLADMIGEGAFREDLFYRISELVIRIPPLRERANDPIVLARNFLNRLNKELGHSVRGFTDDALDALAAHAWPGNVRELENRLKRAIIMAEGKRLTAADLELEEASDGAPSLNLKEVRERAESAALMRALAQVDGNVSQAAKLLGVSRPTLYDLMRYHHVKW